MKFSNPIGLGRLVYYGASALVVLQSLVARQGFIYLSSWITFTSNSDRQRMILISIFAIFWANYGALYLIGPMKIEIPVVMLFSNGIYFDFNQEWYADVGY
jgi:hypothetical protein